MPIFNPLNRRERGHSAVQYLNSLLFSILLRKTLLVSCVVLYLFPAHAYLVKDSSQYYVISQGNYNYIFTDDYKPYLPQVLHYTQHFQNLYEKEFQWVLDEKTSLVLSSLNDQTPNAFATVSPNNLMVFFPGGAGITDRLAETSWLYGLIAHESAHLYQLNAKTRVSSAAKRIMGNPSFGFGILHPITTFVHPNWALPALFTEGNATYNESRFGNGGRLFSGSKRAMFLSLLKDGKITTSRLFNRNLFFPFFGDEKYIIGGYFNVYLAHRYGANKTNGFFKAHSTHYLNPYLLNSTFVSHYDKEYSEVITDFKNFFNPIAQAQKSSSEKEITLSLRASPLTNDGENILFLTTDNYSSPPTLNVFNIQAQTLKKKKTTLPFGRVFQLSDNQYYSATTKAVSPNRQRYSLYDSDLISNTKFEGKIVYDIRHENISFAKAESSIDMPDLYLNDRPIGPVNSSSVLDDLGNVYYFKQNLNIRTLYKNSEALVSYKGYYGIPVGTSPVGTSPVATSRETTSHMATKPTGTNPEREVYFIASTLSGSSLFMASPTGSPSSPAQQVDHGPEPTEPYKIYRLSTSDTIIDAQPLSAHSFLVNEVSSNNYAYKIISTIPHLETPTFYDYPFDKDLNTFNPQIHPLPPVSDTQIKPYNSFKHIRFSSFAPVLGTSGVEGSLYTSFLAQFSDPLQYQKIFLNLAKGRFNEEFYAIQYNYERYLLSPFLGAAYRADSTISTADEILGTFYNSTYYFGLNIFPLYRKGYWGAGYKGTGSYKLTDHDIGETTKEYIFFNNIIVARALTYPLAYAPYSSFSASVGHEFISQAPEWKHTENIISGKLEVSQDLYKEDYLTFRTGGGWAESNAIELVTPRALNARSTNFPWYFSENSTPYKQILFSELEFKKALRTPLYSSIIPVSLRRVAPFAKVIYFQTHTEESSPSPTTITDKFGQWAYGAEVELLLMHKYPLRLDYQTIEGFDEAPSYKQGKTVHSVNLSATFKF